MHHTQKLTQKLGKDLTLRPESIKLLQENMEDTFLDIHLENYFFDRIPKTHAKWQK